VPGGFGNRGVEGKIAAAKYARTHKVPYLGLCLGMQVMVIEYARHVVGLSQANSAEFDESTPHPVIIFMPEINQHVMGGTMRLGSRPTSIYTNYPSPVPTPTSSSSASDPAALLIQIPSNDNGNDRTLACDVYSTHTLDTDPGAAAAVHPISERHRHRYEVNPIYVNQIQRAGLFFSGVDDKLERMEIAELSRKVHPFYFGTQFHPEFKSRPNRPSPPVYAFIAVAAGLTHQLGFAGDMWQRHVDEIHLQSFDALPPTPFRAYAAKQISSPTAQQRQELPVPPLEKKRSIRAISS
jgi:CTP synthase